MWLIVDKILLKYYKDMSYLNLVTRKNEDI